MEIGAATVYESIPASSAMAMAVMESSGIRALIDSIVEHNDQRRLSPGMAVKAMIGPIFDSRKKMPLSGVRGFYKGAPVDMLFGKDVTESGLNDHALARNLDDLYDAGLDGTFWKCSSMIKHRYGFDSKVRHMDSTNYTLYALPSERDGEAVPVFGGNAKDGRNDLIQYNAATVTDGDRIIEYAKAYSGNTADPVMDRDTIGFLRANIDPKENTLIADCKLVNTELISELLNMGMGFISKAPSSFSDKIRDDIVYSAVNGRMDVSGLDGYSVYDTEADTVCGKLRFIAYRSPKGTAKEMDYLERQGKKDAERLFKPFVKKRFACEKDAMMTFDETLSKHKGSAYVIGGTPVAIEEIVRRETRGRPPKGSEAPGSKVSWKIDISMRFDRELAENIAKAYDVSVIVTNLPFATEDAENVRHGATTDTVLKLYLDQYKVEHTYRLMKSGMGVDSVYVHTPSRANALLFVISIATLISSIMDALMRRNGHPRTVRKICSDLQNAAVIYDRCNDRLTVGGPNGSMDDLFFCLGVFDTAPSLLLGVGNG
ncbi:MAG: IS1634 family transposase [Candidatus Methanomethylophilaceae archaeon]|jgi:transposase